jgi:hypothetical protein
MSGADGSWTNQIVSNVTIIGTGGELLVYSPTAGAGNLIVSVAGSSGTDQFGNVFVEGIASYASGLAIQLGLGNFFGLSVPGLFVHNIGSPAISDPFFGSLANGEAAITSGQSTGLASQCGVELQDSVASGTGQPLASITGNVIISGTLSVNGSTDTGNAGLTDGSIINTSGPASAGTAHTHSAGTYHVSNANHVHPL